MTTNKLGSSFATPIVLVGIVISMAGIISLIESPLLGIGLTLAGAFFWSSSYGIQLDKGNNRFREYGSIFGIKRGEWKALKELPYVSVLNARSSSTMFSQSNRSTTHVEDYLKVCLLDREHRRKVTVKKFTESDQALAYGKQLAVDLEKELVTYSPHVSAQSRERRRPRR